MPHVVLQGEITPEDIWLAFEPEEFTEGGNRFKAEEAFLSSGKDTVLIRSLTVERGFTKTFNVRFLLKEGKLTIGLEKLTMPDASEGVKRLIGLYAWKILQSAPEVTIASTNIQEFIREPAA